LIWNEYKKKSYFPKKDELLCGCFQKIDDKHYMQVYKSFSSPQKCPVDKNIDRINVEKGGTVFRRDISGLKGREERWNLENMRICDYYSQTAKVIKPTLKTEAKRDYALMYKLLEQFSVNCNDEESHNKLIEKWLKFYRKN